jgi:hypothetical protein
LEVPEKLQKQKFTRNPIENIWKISQKNCENLLGVQGKP